jgi:hypothetical protein
MAQNVTRAGGRAFDQPLVPLAVALRSMLMETEAKIATPAPELLGIGGRLPAEES